MRRDPYQVLPFLPLNADNGRCVPSTLVLTVGAICCTRTDAELRELLTPTLADRITACSEPFTVWAKRAWRTGARFDTVEWARKASFFTMGSMTFKEAYERTGRIFNVSGTWARRTRVLASSSVPGR